MDKPRFGLIGTGIWARTVQAPAAAACGSVAFTSVFGRREAAALEIAKPHGARAFASLDAFLDSVDIVGISLVPDAQPDFALAAVAAGKHLLLEKPVATDPAKADAIADAVSDHGLASAVFFTRLFMPQVRQWIDEARAAGGWLSGRAETFAQVTTDPNNPFHGTAWRSRIGALWDIGPHAVSLLCAVLGDVAEVYAVKGRGDLTQMMLTHRDGAVSTIAMSLDAPAPLPGGTVLFGSAGCTQAPGSSDWMGDSIRAYATAIADVTAAAAGGAPVRFDARFGARMTAILAAAEASKANESRVALAIS
jgi:predicted dehydrogenase